MGESPMPLASAKAMSLTMLELWSLVRPEQDMRGSYILMTGMTLLAVSSRSWWLNIAAAVGGCCCCRVVAKALLICAGR